MGFFQYLGAEFDIDTFIAAGFFELPETQTEQRFLGVE
jgi:hypothetical protein